MPNINIALDIETLSLQPTAAIISIAAKTFHLPQQEEEDNNRGFYKNISMRSLLKEPQLSISETTLKWWQEQLQEVIDINFNPYTAVTIQEALTDLKTFIRDIRTEYNDIAIWTQGTDFDIPILRHAYHTILHEKEPWHRHELRDARTVIRMSNKNIPYPPKDMQFHNPTHDVEQLILNITHIL